MLNRLYISNVVLISQLELDFPDTMSVLTGETGAGKSILLDALALALGGKSDTSLIRTGCESATVVAEFDDKMLKRVLFADGKSKCYLNDEPVTLKTLKDIGDELIEIHGQFANHSLLDEKTHINLLDAFGGYDTVSVKSSFAEFHDAELRLKKLQELIEKSKQEREWLEHNIAELDALNPKIGEEQSLAETRQKMIDAEKNSGILKDVCEILEKGGISEKIFSAAHILERTKSYQKEISELYELGGKVEEIADKIKPADFDTIDLEQSEERLFALRAAARKHRISVDELPSALAKMHEQLGLIDNSDSELKKCSAEVATKKKEYEKFASTLTQERVIAAKKLTDAVKKELPDLKLGTADFMVDITPNAPSEKGNDAVRFLIKTNPGSPFAPLDKIASGGELARFMLALRVVLMHGKHTLIFDEIDTGISGATAAAVGARLAKLASQQQIIVITHSAQVAGFGNSHFLIAKTTDGKTTTTSVKKLSGDDRIQEIARIISGAKISPDALATAKELIQQ